MDKTFLWHHQQPDVNYIQVLEKVVFSCTVHAQRAPLMGNQVTAETGLTVHFWLLVAVTWLQRQPSRR